MTNKELALKNNKNYIFKLNNLQSLNVIGEKSVEFLQGQLTADISKVNANQMTPSALCNIQGRIIALLNVVSWHGLQLILPKDLAEIVQNNLQKKALFSRVKIETSKSQEIFGFYLQNPNDKVPLDANLPKAKYSITYNDAYCCFSITDNLFIFIVNNDYLENFTNEFSNEQILQSGIFHSLYLKAGYIDIYANTTGLFLPHRLDLQKTQYLSFNKGCYIGQEIIARTHYKAKLKHSLKQFLINTSEPLCAGQKIYLSNSDNKTEIGELIDFSPIGNDNFIIAISSVFDHDLTVHFENHKSTTALKHQAFPLKFYTN
jgi:folate-binding protein YgfZ